MTFVFGIVVAHELLFARTHLHPVAVLHGGGVARTLLLLLHLGLKLLLVNLDAALTTDKLRQVERESVGVEEAESLRSVEHRLAFSLHGVDGVAEHIDTV